MEKQEQLSMMQSSTDELEADLDRLLALKQQVGQSRENPGPQEPTRSRSSASSGEASSRPS